MLHFEQKSQFSNSKTILFIHLIYSCKVFLCESPDRARVKLYILYGGFRLNRNVRRNYFGTERIMQNSLNFISKDLQFAWPNSPSAEVCNYKLSILSLICSFCIIYIVLHVKYVVCVFPKASILISYKHFSLISIRQFAPFSYTLNAIHPHPVNWYLLRKRALSQTTSTLNIRRAVVKRKRIYKKLRFKHSLFIY